MADCQITHYAQRKRKSLTDITLAHHCHRPIIYLVKFQLVVALLSRKAYRFTV